MAAGLPVSDYDFATDAMPEKVMTLFRHVIPTGIKHGTVTVIFRHHHFEVTTFRVDGIYTDLRRPNNVSYTPSIYEDLKRRDFSINAMALNLSTGELLDPHEGREDLKRGIIRAIGDPAERFAEDALRILRGCRFIAQLGFTVEGKTYDAMRLLHGNLALVSAERIRDEFIKILAAPRPSLALKIMDNIGLLKIILPELEGLKKVTLKTEGDIDVFDHSLTACDVSLNDPIIRLAALLHDIGKAEALTLTENGGFHFHNHELLSADMAEILLERLKFPKNVQYAVSHLIRNHMFYYDDNISDAALRRLISRVGKEYLNHVLQLRFADTKAISGSGEISLRNRNMERRIGRIVEETEALTIADLKVNGNDLAEFAGIPKGPVMGEVLKMLMEAVLDDPSLNDREKLLKIGKNFYKERLM